MRRSAWPIWERAAYFQSPLLLLRNSSDFLEGSYLNQLTPAKKLGAMLHGQPIKGVNYGVSVFQEGFNETTNETARGKQLAGRAAINLAETAGWKDSILHLGLAGISGEYNITPTTSSQTSAAASTTTRGTVVGFRSAARGLTNIYRAQLAGDALTTAAYSGASNTDSEVNRRMQGFELAAAYGIAVTGTMLIDTILVAFVMVLLWRWNPLVVAIAAGALLAVDLSFFAANVIKIPEGGWFPIVMGLLSFTVLTTWRHGRKLVADRGQALQRRGEQRLSRHGDAGFRPPLGAKRPKRGRVGPGQDDGKQRGGLAFGRARHGWFRRSVWLNRSGRRRPMARPGILLGSAPPRPPQPGYERERPAMPIVNRIAEFHRDMTAWRRDIHAHPETAFQEHRTSGIVAEKLASFGIEVHRGLAKTGVVGVLKSGAGRRAIGLRADMDALDMPELNGFAHCSKHAGKMHACGHDGHTTMLLGAARYLAETREFDGTAYLIFQPAEEGGAGGDAMVKEGLFEKFPADQVYALHNWPLLEPGKIAVRPGPVMAATDEILITVRGKGGHGALPHLAVDPVVATAQLIGALQTVASRNVSPIDAVVVSLCSVQTSQVGAFNVIPESVKLVGTVRTFRPETRALAERRVREIAAGVTQALGASAEVEYRRGYPPTVNSAREAEFAARVGERLFGPQNVLRDAEPTMGGEDFSYMLQARPGAYVFLGQGGGELGCLLHNPNYDFNDEVIPLGAGYLAALVEESLPIPKEEA